jgi:hypothetical protein
VEAAGSVVLVCARSDATPLPAKDASRAEAKESGDSTVGDSTRGGDSDSGMNSGGDGGSSVPAAWAALAQGGLGSAAGGLQSRKLLSLAPLLGCAASGLLPDAGVLVDAARTAVRVHVSVWVCLRVYLCPAPPCLPYTGKPPKSSGAVATATVKVAH